MIKTIKCYIEHKHGKYGGCSIPHLHEINIKNKKNEIKRIRKNSKNASKRT